MDDRLRACRIECSRYCVEGILGMYRWCGREYHECMERCLSSADEK